LPDLVMKHGAWTEREIAFIRQQWRTLDDAGLAAALDRPMSSVASKRLKLGLKRPRANGDGRYVDR
jgi:hypothetical protein